MKLLINIPFPLKPDYQRVGEAPYYLGMIGPVVTQQQLTLQTESELTHLLEFLEFNSDDFNVADITVTFSHAPGELALEWTGPKI